MTLDKTSISPSSPQFQRLEYMLQIALHACTARITEAYQYSIPHQLLNFEKRAQNRLVLPSWVDATSLSGAHPAEELMKRTATGMIFPVGRIPIPQQKTKESQKFVKKMLLCDVVVGRSFATSAKNASLAKEVLPEGYDSFYMFDGEKDSEQQTHNYWIKDGNQVLPTYLVTFEFDPVDEKRSREKPICDNCEQTYATVYCHADGAHFCDDCDTRLHMANKVLQKHNRVPVGKGSDALGHCRIHAGQTIEFFCTQCQQPVCVHCKMVGHHSSGEAARHKLVTVAEAFDSVLKESTKKEVGLQAKHTAIGNHLKLISARTKQVEEHHAMLEAELQKLFESLLTNLRQKTAMKLNVLLSDELECRRLVQEMQIMEGFLEYQQTGRDVYPLLVSWGRHVQLRQEWMETRQLREDIDVFCDLKIAGNLAIGIDELAERPPKTPRKSIANNGTSNASPMKNIEADTESPSQKPQSASNAPTNTTNNHRAPSVVAMQAASNPKRHAVRRTSDFFAETLNALSALNTSSVNHCEQASAYSVNVMMDDEQSFTTTGYEEHVKY